VPGGPLYFEGESRDGIAAGIIRILNQAGLRTTPGERQERAEGYRWNGRRATLSFYRQVTGAAAVKIAVDGYEIGSPPRAWPRPSTTSWSLSRPAPRSFTLSPRSRPADSKEECRGVFLPSRGGISVAERPFMRGLKKLGPTSSSSNYILPLFSRRPSISSSTTYPWRFTGMVSARFARRGCFSFPEA